MGFKGSFGQHRSPTLEQQLYRMRVLWPGFQVSRMKRQVEIVWHGDLQPTPLSKQYRISIKCLPNRLPKAFVLSPALKLRDDAKCLPHVYQDGSLCLHDYGEWQPWMYVADYFVPWICCWLYFYEVWYAVGYWEGGGTHPEKPEHRAA